MRTTKPFLLVEPGGTFSWYRPRVHVPSRVPFNPAAPAPQLLVYTGDRACASYSVGWLQETAGRPLELDGERHSVTYWLDKTQQLRLQGMYSVEGRVCEGGEWGGMLGTLPPAGCSY